MPTYVYACTECGHGFEAVQAFSDDTLTTCPECSGKLHKVFNSVGIVFKGSGFYRNDSRDSKTSSSGASSSSESSSESSTSGSTSSGDSTSADAKKPSDSTPAKKADSASTTSTSKAPAAAKPAGSAA